MGDVPPNGTAPVVLLDPIVTPLIRAFEYGPLANAYMRPGFQGPPRADDDTWRASGCHANALTMVLNWWAVQRAPAEGASVFVAREGEHPIARGATAFSIAGALWGSRPPPADLPEGARFVYVPYVSGRGGQLVDHNAVTRAALNTRWRRGGAVTGISHETAVLSDRSARFVAFRRLLRCGPLLAQIDHPGHFIVIYGFRDDWIYVCDPGCIVRNHWHAPTPTDDTRQIAHGTDGTYLRIRASAQLVYRWRERRGGPWLSRPLNFTDDLSILDSFSFPGVAVDTQAGVDRLGLRFLTDAEEAGETRAEREARRTTIHGATRAAGARR